MRYEVQGHGEYDNNWESSYAGDDTQCDTYEDAEKYIDFLVNEAFPETNRSDWRIVEI